MSNHPPDFVVLETFSEAVEPNIIKGALEAEGIESFIVGENSTSVLPYLIGGIRLMVHTEDLEKARKILLQNNTDEPEQS